MRFRLGCALLVVFLAVGPSFGQVLPFLPVPVETPPHREAEGHDKPAEHEKHAAGEGAEDHPRAEPFTPNPDGEHHEAEEEKHEEELPPCHRVWITGEYLLWRIRDSRPPLLATAGSLADPVPGAQGQMSTIPLYGGANLDNNWHSGARLFAGGWFDEGDQYGAELGYFFLGTRNVGFFQSNAATLTPPVLARPFFNAATNAFDASLLSVPGVIGGALRVTNSSFLEGAEANGLANLLETRGFHLEALAGPRWIYLKEYLNVLESDQVSNGIPIVMTGTSYNVFDSFTTTNNFYGGQVGFKASVRRDSWHLDVFAKVAVGVMDEEVGIHGATVIGQPSGAVATYPYGLLALASNSGDFHRSIFAFAPEVGAHLTYKITENLYAMAGYNFLYLNNVMRPGEQVDTTLNPALIPTSLNYGASGGPPRPFFNFQGTDFFAHGATFGLLFQY